MTNFSLGVFFENVFFPKGVPKNFPAIKSAKFAA